MATNEGNRKNTRKKKRSGERVWKKIVDSLLSSHFPSSSLLFLYPVSLLFISFYFISFHFISFHFISFHFISFHFITLHFLSLLLIYPPLLSSPLLSSPLLSSPLLSSPIISTYPRHQNLKLCKPLFRCIFPLIYLNLDIAISM